MSSRGALLRATAAMAIVTATATATASCKREPEITCRVNGVCFVCPDAKAKAACLRDPAASRCKWAEPSRCK